LENTCSELLDYCLRGEEWPGDLLDRAIALDEGRALFSIVVERLGDLFEPRLSDVYARLFTQAIQRVAPELLPRVRDKREPPQAPASADRVYVLSRVTLGADVAVTSVLLDTAKRRYPEAEIVLVGPRKSWELFEADPRIRHMDAFYARNGTLADRLRASASLWLKNGIVIDPDSRLTQLGLISVCDEDRYFHFESRARGSDSDKSLPVLASEWALEVFGVADARTFIAPRPATGPAADITVSLGVGENPAKRLDAGFERDLFRMLAETGASVLADKGGTAEERERVERSVTAGMRTHDGAFAPFAAEIAKSKLYVGYDSAGGHVAAACGVPSIIIFAGAVCDRFFERWKPPGKVIRGEDPDLHSHVRDAIAETQNRF
jgi:ADP-heptose:LPS heptosyltransferase